MEEARLSFVVLGMSCSTCAANVQKALIQTPGVKFASVNLATEKAFVVGDPGLNFFDLAESVLEVGYTAQQKLPTADQTEKRFAAAWFDSLLALALTLPLAVGMVLHMAKIWHPPGWTWIELVGTTLVLVGPGRKTLWGAWVALTHRHTNMDTLICIGAVTAWSTMLLHQVLPGVISYGTVGAMIMAFSLVGRTLEAKLKWKASRDLRALEELFVTEARVLFPDGSVDFIPMDALGVGDRVLLEQGDTVPADGQMTEGSILADESLVTGEPMPYRRETGSSLTGGTKVVTGKGTLVIEAVGEASFLGRMIRLVEAAQSVQIPLQAVADKVTRFFTPVVLGLATLAALVWFLFYPVWVPFLQTMQAFLPWVTPQAGNISIALLVFVTTVVIACPCALALATPMALLAGTSLAARHGLLLRSGESVEQARRLDTLVLDKTGTLTLGRPVVEESTLPDAYWPLAAALEQASNHPLAFAILEYYESRFSTTPLPDLGELEEIAGTGVFGVWQGQRVAMTKPARPEIYQDWMRRGMTVMEFQVEGQPLGALGVRDPIKGGARETLRALRARGLCLIMATGDHETTARAIAAELELDDVRAGIRPEGKFQLIQELQRQGRVVGMVGDGINDAAALKQADVGFAMGAGTKVSMESADIVLTRNSLESLTDTLVISKVTFRQIYRNLFWAFFYNVLVIPAALAGLLPPAAAEIAMTLSSVNVLWGSGRIPALFEKFRRNK